MRQSLFGLILTTTLMCGQSALADDCGFPPDDWPTLPDGATIDRENMDAGVRAVREFSIKMNAYFDCLQMKRDEQFFNMSRDQQARWIEDFNALVDSLAELETSMNQEIRAYNNRKS